MLLARGWDTNGDPIIIVGLEYGNLDKLREGKPIMKDLSLELNLRGKLVIMAGETKEGMAAEFTSLALQSGATMRGDAPMENLKK